MKSLFFFTVFFPAFAFASLLSATKYCVNGITGNNSYDGLAPERDGTHGPKKTIQAGIGVSTDTDTVIVADGSYTGAGNNDPNFGGKAVTVRGENSASSGQGHQRGRTISWRASNTNTSEALRKQRHKKLVGEGCSSTLTKS